MRLTIAILLVLMLYSVVDSQHDGLIVYSNYDWKLYTMHPDGSNQREIVTDLSYISNPSWSQEQQAFLGVSEQIYYIDVFRNHQFKLTQDMSPFIESTVDNMHPEWSPDGNKIAFASQYYGHFQLFMMDSDGRNQERLIESEESDGNYGLTWLFGGTHIAFVREYGYHFNEETQTHEDKEIILLNLATGETVNITKNLSVCGAGDIIRNPRWSESSQKLAFSLGCGTADNISLYIANAATPEDLLAFEYQMLMSDQYLMQGYDDIAWSPDGTRLAFTAYVDDETPGSEIFVMDVEATLNTGEPVYEQITDTPTNGRYRGLDWIDSVNIGN